MPTMTIAIEAPSIIREMCRLVCLTMIPIIARMVRVWHG